MPSTRKRIIGSEADNSGPALQIYFLRQRKKPSFALWFLIALVVVPLGAWIDATTRLPVFGAVFLLIGWRLWRVS